MIVVTMPRFLTLQTANAMKEPTSFDLYSLYCNGIALSIIF